ncbi:16S rRNA (cytosine967-C5)-methyltransferase [Acetitomaculum ruminis DSM 5522]|uniref:16S rRNA (cytosine(967)-C(5))-methyltransferase n=1 Tax=Acetitomaculum ruminis DSM 5522 TaxID=1120918 RepID=A0A1I0XVZ6_9FIRM|nr:16S rRNA (cytosine(967)-C(5))-methyltransferase RsmB [Acetitomaculum ruminis]SFB04338.1 16S rRNA (cytosine967-C5)-methyltransferase [Acetitomaculum ruminis DSM 5522]
MKTEVNLRKIIHEILMESLENGAYLTETVNAVLDKFDYLDKKEKSFIKIICLGTVEKLIYLDYVLDSFSKIPVRKMKADIRNILRSSLYQALFMESVPDSAICNEAVKLTKSTKCRSLSGFVNGLLRNILRNRDKIKLPDEKNEANKYYSVKYSMPQWIIEQFRKDFGKEKLEIMLSSINEKKKNMIRIDTGKIKPNKLVGILSKKGINLTKGPYLDECYYIDNVADIQSLEEFKKGFFYIQDVSSMISVLSAGIKKEDTVFDVCAAPGGKSIFAALLTGEKGQVKAFDNSFFKEDKVNYNIEKSGYKNISFEIKDATIYDKNLEKKADVLICDAPCSGLGVLRRKPDIRYRITKEDEENLALLQRNILKNVQNYVKPGGVLLYSTCTMNHIENDENVKWFKENFPFEPESLDSFIPKELQCDTTKEGYLQLITGIHQSDGFFIARFRRKEND